MRPIQLVSLAQKYLSTCVKCLQRSLVITKVFQNIPLSNETKGARRGKMQIFAKENEKFRQFERDKRIYATLMQGFSLHLLACSLIIIQLCSMLRNIITAFIQRQFTQAL